MIRGAIVAASLSALLLWASSPAVGAGWLAWIALVPAAVVALRGPGARAARLAVPLTYALYLELLLVPAFPFGVAEGQWGDPALPVMVADSPVLAIALVAVPLFGALLYLIRFGQPWGAGSLPARWLPAAAILIPALAWTALDFIRVQLDPGSAWGPLFLSQAGTPAADLAAVAGPWLITFAVVAVNYALAAALVHRRVALAAVPVAASAGLVAIGALVTLDGEEDRRLAVAAIQPGYDTAEEDRPVLRFFESGTWPRAALDVAADLAAPTALAADRGARLVVWPEATMYVDPQRRPRVMRALTELTAGVDVSLVLPYFLPDPDRSELIALEPTGEIAGPRAKQRPMWYLGESGLEGDRPRPLTSGSRRLGTLLGIDSQDPAVARALATQGSELLTSSTHDFAGSVRSRSAHARLVAIAAGRSVVRADWRYGSAVYGPDGSELAAAGPALGRDLVLAEAPLETGTTPYVRIGDAFAWAAVGLSVLAALAAALPARLRRGRTRVSPRRSWEPSPR